jgi:hypothetical protein
LKTKIFNISLSVYFTMRQPIILLSALAGFALAQDPQVSFFFPGGYEGVSPVASVVTANPTTTVLDITCPTGVDSTECGWGPGIEVSIISTTIYEATMSEAGLFTMTYSCNHNTKASEITCAASMGGSGANDPGVSTAVLSGSDIAFVTASVTSGADLLSATGGAKESTTASATGASGTAAQKSGSSTTASGAAPENTGAAYRFGVEGSALLVLAGAAALNAW